MIRWEEKQLLFLHNNLEKEASRFYNNNAKDIAKSINGAVIMIGAKYNSSFGQERVKIYVNNLRAADFVSGNKEIPLLLQKCAKVYCNWAGKYWWNMKKTRTT